MRSLDVMYEELMHRAWAEINLDAIAHNMQQIRKAVSSNSKIMAVVKADAYGHGFLQVAKTLIDNHADMLAVAVIDEAKQLRSRGIEVPILILGTTSYDHAEDIVDFDVMPTVFNYKFAKLLSDIAVKKDKDVKIHIKIDTGMSRIGYLYHGKEHDNVIKEILDISKLPNLEINGIFSHFSKADEPDSEYTELQFSRFTSLCNALEQNGLHIQYKHICNSAGLIKYPHMHLDMVRPGIILYGLYPEDALRSAIDLKPAMELKAKITRVQTIPKGTPISYGGIYKTNADAKIATVPIGYADGYSRNLTGKAKMCVGEEIVNVVGKICMDQCMIDVTNVNNINEGDQVKVFGCDKVTADSLAEWLNTINYEVVCFIGKRIPRIYLSGGKAVRVINYIV